ncbi:hypothetical protein JTE90_007438 [Oedothorax gibbosus]|uniref:Uncharacterized protein n=1 Tax=Oedothorax gibbosus TaxID=931172 RepID=A0AAV6UNN0_9ARAC|nr:hypothetical protein JTE90_007438 [Oedothorax gibbosus]
MELVFEVTSILWIISYAEVLEDLQHKRKVLERKFWRGDNATLVHEVLFSDGIVLAFGFDERMVLQIAYFLAFCLIITTFSIALTRMYAYYDGMKRTDKDGNTRTQLSTFSTRVESSNLTNF